MTTLDEKLNAHFDGKIVRKDLVQRVKKGTNVPTFVLEFLLARYCASNDPDEAERAIVYHLREAMEIIAQAMENDPAYALEAEQNEKA